MPLIAETGGQNAMLVDSSALPEQVVHDVVRLGVRQRRASAARRCACCACRRTSRRACIELLAGAMDELVIGDPARLATDVGPVIDDDARDALEAHVAAMRAAGLVRHRAALPRRSARRHVRRAAR